MNNLIIVAISFIVGGSFGFLLSAVLIMSDYDEWERGLDEDNEKESGTFEIPKK